MGDASPDRIDLVCPSCETEFRRIVGSDVPPTFECPDCGEPVDVPEAAGRDDSSGGATDEELRSTARVEMPPETGTGTEPIEEEDTAQDQESLERAREKSTEINTVGGRETEPSERAGEEGYDSERSESSGRDPSEATGPGESPGGSRGESRSRSESSTFGAQLDPGSEANDDFDEEDVHDRETTVGKNPLSERDEETEATDEGNDEADPEKTPAMGMDRVAEEMADSDVGEESTEAVAAEAEGSPGSGRPPEAPPAPSPESDRETEDSATESEGPEADAGERTPTTTPSAGLDSAFDDTVPPDIGEETEEAIDEALEEQFQEMEGDEGAEAARGEDDAGGPTSASDLVDSLREKTGDFGDESSDAGATAGDGASTEDPPPGDSEPGPTDGTRDGQGVPPPIESSELEEENESSGGPPDIPDEPEKEAPRPESDDAPRGRDGVDREGGAPVSDGEDGPVGSKATGVGGGAAESELPDTREGEPVEFDDEPGAPPAELDGESSLGASESIVDEDAEGASTLLIAVGAAGIAVVALGAVAILDPLNLLSDGRTKTTASASSSGASPEVDAAVKRAKKRLHEGLAVDPNDPQLQRKVADRLYEDESYGEASRIYGVLWPSRRSNTDFAKRYVRSLIRGGRYTEARRISTEAIQTTGERSTFESTYYEALEKDDRLHGYDPVSLAELDAVNSIEPVEKLDAGEFKLTGLDGSVEYVFSPASEPSGQWRDDIAAWRLCELLVCSFEIPHTRPARITREEFERMYDGGSSSAARAAQGLDWRQADGDGTYVPGSLREWPGETVRWPIELVDLWRPWLSAYNEPSNLEVPLDEALQGIESLGDGSTYRRILEASKGISTRRLASQLSDIVLFDFLTNNWGRFADDESEYGSRNHFADGRFVTLHTGTVFQRRKSTRVKGRFGWVSRFGRDRMTALRMLESERIDSVLYPDATPYDDSKLEIFWDQRETALERVDELVGEMGRDRVLTFE